MKHLFVDAELITKLLESNEIMSSIKRITNISSNNNSPPGVSEEDADLAENTSDIHLLARRVLNTLEEFKSIFALETSSKRSSLGQKQR